MWCAAVSEDFSNFAYLISTAMALNYEDIVREWYNRLRPAFMRKYNPQNEMLRALETKRCFF